MVTFGGLLYLMRTLFMTLLLGGIAQAATAQCEFVDISVSSATETSVQLYTPAEFLIPFGQTDNVYFWDITETDGNIITQETVEDLNPFFLFNHTVPITDTIVACLTVTNEVAGPGISCTVCDSLSWGGPIIEWESNNNEGGSFEATEAPLPNYFLAGQSAPCPPRVINFQNFTFGSDEVLWTFPGGEPATSTAENQLVTYNSPGDYSFTIEVTNSAGSNSFTSTDEITVFPNPTADFDFTSSELDVTFENLSEGDLPGQTPDYFWDFGDSNTSTEENPVHTYELPGTYEVILSITNQCGTTEESYEVTVTSIGVEEIKTELSMEVTPNPNKGQFALEIQHQKNAEITVRLTNVMGQRVLDVTEMLVAGHLRKELSLNDVNAGVYILSVSSGEGIAATKVIIQ